MGLRYITAAAAIAVALTSAGQNLHQEIEVESEIVPVEREATRLSISPAISLPSAAPARLSLSERAVAAPITRRAPFLQPAAYADTLFTSHWRGYAAGAIWPLPFNTSLSAGYRLVDTDRMNLSVWLQGNSANYKASTSWLGDKKVYWRDETLSAGADMRWSAGKESTLRVAADYTLDNYNNMAPSYDGESGAVHTGDRYWQTLNLVNVEARWYSRVGGLKYDGGLTVGHTSASHGAFHHTPSMVDDPILSARLAKPVRETRYDLSGHGMLELGDVSKLTLDADIDLSHLSRHTTLAQGALDSRYTMADNPSKTRGLITITPGYTLTTGRVTARLGVNLQVSINSGKSLHVSPDVLLGWNPQSWLAVRASLKGGVVTNTLAEVYGLCRYFNPSIAYNYSNVPLDGELRLTVGPWRSAYIEVTGGWSRANSTLMPTRALDSYSTTAFMPVDVKGFHYSVAAGYTYRRLASVKLSYTGTQGGDIDKGYYRNIDRARHVVEASVKVDPTDRLQLTANYQLRAQRSILDSYMTMPADGGTLPLVHTSAQKLPNISTLDIAATYRVSERMTLGLRGENLLNRAAVDVALRPLQPLMGYVTASYLF